MVNQGLINGIFFLLLAVIGWFVRGTVARMDECQKHNETRIASLSSSLEAWKLESSRTHERMAGNAELSAERHVQNQRTIHEIKNAVMDLTERVNRALESVPTIIDRAQQPIGRRLDVIEEKVKAVKFFLDHDDEEKD